MRSPRSVTVALTQRQQQVLEVVERHIAEHGYPPTVREIGEAVGLTSPSTVHAHLKALEASGALTRDATKPRAIDLAERRVARDERRRHTEEIVAGVRVLPLLGRIAAGAPILAEENVEEHIPVPEQITGSGDNFLLTVRGDSMIEAGILDGDTVVVRSQEDCADGAIVACLVDGEEATVKYLHRDAGRIRLDPANAALEPFFPDEVQVMGLVVGVFRRI
jgi:repressor LexA